MLEMLKLKHKGMDETARKNPFEGMTLSQKMEVIGKMIANLCSTEQKVTGGNSMSFKVSGITDVRDGSSLGTVTISWEIDDEHQGL